MTTTTLAPADAVPVGPGLSMFDPIFIGIDEFGHPVYLDVVYRNILIAGEPGGGKSGLVNNVCAHGALSDLTRLVLFDAKLVELGPWRDIADAFIGPDLDEAISVLRRLLVVATNRYTWLLANRRRKLAPGDGMSVIVTIIDELAMFSTVLGTKPQQEEFSTLLRGLVSLGRACGMPVVAATQRPSWDIIPASLRDLFGYRAAFRCTTLNSSNIILGQGWAEQGYTASDISPTNQGAAYLLAEGGVPRRIKAAYLTDTDIYNIADYAAWTRRPTAIPATPADIDWGVGGMTTRERAYARASNQRMAQYTELWIIGMPEDIATLIQAASANGQLAYASAPERVSRDDPRMRRYLRLRVRTHHQ